MASNILSQDQNAINSINDNLLFNNDMEQSYKIERIHRNSADSSSSERTLYVSYFDLQDAFKSSIYDKPEEHACDCATKLAFNKKMLEVSQIQIIKNEQNEPQKEQPQKILNDNNNQVYILFALVSIISYAVGYFGFTSVWLIIVLYQSIKWYINMVKDHKERVRWEVNREMSMNKLGRDGETVEWLNHLLQQIWRTFDPNLLTGLRDTIEDTMSRCAPSFVRATDIEFELGIIAPRIENIKILPRREDQDDEDLVTGEATFSFRARSSSTMTCKDTPPYVLAWIKTGMSIIPIKVELIGFKASIRFQVKIAGTSPFISTGSFSFLTTPFYKPSIMPLIPMNIAQFPIIEQFIQSTLQTVLEQFTYPNRIDLDLEQLLMGDDLLHETQAIGILRVDIFEARNLARVDLSGDNDPYVISTLDPSHTQSTTRVIEDCLEPVWKETFFHKVPELDLLDKFKLRVMDWDRFTADDHIGSIWIDLKNEIGKGNYEKLIYNGWKEIRTNPNDNFTSPRGELCFRLEYYPKLPIEVQEKPEQTSGIFGLKIHQAMNLQITTAPYIEETFIDNHYDSAYPNPYAVVYLNDSRVFRTRAKLNNVAPFWNASTEQFVRDWKTAIVRIVIKDQKDLEYDPVIGMVTLPLKDLFEEKGKKEVTKWYPLRDGVGCGKVRLSFIFRTISMILPPEEKGYDVGTLLVHSIIAEGLDSYYANRSVYLTLTIRNTEIEQETEASNLFPPRWLNQRSKNDTENRMEFAVFRRYRASLIITVKRKGLLGVYHTVGMAEYWLKDIEDCCETEVEIPILEILPKCFPSSQNKYESQESINFDDIPKCESPESSQFFKSLCDSNLTTPSENTTEETQSTIDSKDVISHEEVCKSSSSSSQSNEKSEQNDVCELDNPNSSSNYENNNYNDKEDNKDNNNNQLSSKSIEEDSSGKSVTNTLTETPLANKLLKGKSKTNISGKVDSRKSSSSGDISNENSDSNKIKGHLKFKVYFRPGLSLSHEENVKRSLTGANASILYENPFCTSEDINEQRRRSCKQDRQSSDIYKGKSISGGENYEPDKRRINSVHRRRTMRQLQWVTDLVTTKVTSLSGKREWEDQEVIEHEL